MRVKPPTLPRYISIMSIICDAKLNFGVIPKVNPTVPIAEAVSNKLATNGNFSIVQIETPPMKKSVMYIITIVAALFITLSSILLPNAQTCSFRLKQAKALRISLEKVATYLKKRPEEVTEEDRQKCIATKKKALEAKKL